MKTPDRTTAAAFPRYSTGEVVADSATLRWPGLYARRLQFPRVVDRFLVPATAEPLISCVVGGSAEFEERELDGPWVTRRLERGDIFVTRASAPYELRWTPRGKPTSVAACRSGNSARWRTTCVSSLRRIFPSSC